MSIWIEELLCSDLFTTLLYAVKLKKKNFFFLNRAPCPQRKTRLGIKLLNENGEELGEDDLEYMLFKM